MADTSVAPVFDYGRIFRLSERFARGTFRVHALGELPGGSPHALTRGEIQPSEPVRFTHDEGSRIKDYIGTTWGALSLVSERLISALDGFSGWQTYPVEVFDERGRLVVGYHGLAVTGRSGPIDNRLNPVEVLPPPVPQGKASPHRIGLRFRPKAWDGSDVFCPGDTAFIFMTQDAKDALVTAKVTGIELDRITEIALPLAVRG
ncbi:MAG: hypothetical protein QOG85_472 [Gaiellaceae bacterium]|jgi:hypothetical protein|nr:hypothetical protein [Gaiellaceae bacterium]